jgi:type I restriction enzyme S subunit
MRGASGSTAQPHLYLKDIRRIPIPLPSRQEQDEITEYIQRMLFEQEFALKLLLDCERDRNALRQSILKSGFEGQLVPQDPSEEPASKCLARLRAESTPAAHRGWRGTS